MSKPKKASQEKNKLKKGRAIREDDGPKDFRQERDNAEYVREKIEFNLQIKERNDYTAKQEEILDAIEDPSTSLIIIDGLWGSTKSFLATLGALRLLNTNKYSNVIYSRNPVESSNCSEVGTQPGTVEEKMEVYNVVFKDKLRELLPPKEAAELLKSTVKFIPPGFLRGRSFDSTIIVLDEASCLSYEDFLLVVSRVGKNTKLVVCGDDFQADIRNSGFDRFFKAFYNQRSFDNGVRCFELRQPEDILRSGFVRFAMEQLQVIKFDKKEPKEERECAAGLDFMAGKIEEGDLIERAPADPPKKFWEKLKFW